MIEKKEVEFAKELDDVMKLVTKVVKTIKEKGDYAAILPELIAAIEGVGDIDDEFKASMKAFVLTSAEGVYDIVDIFLPKKEVVA